MDGLRSGVTLLIAVVLIAAGGVIVAFMFINVSADEPTWQRYVLLLTGVEAVVFAAVGWLFGKEVHREQADNAENARKTADVDKQQAVADAASAEARGRGLAQAVIAAAGGPERAQSLAGDSVGDPQMAQLVRQAKALYPDA